MNNRIAITTGGSGGHVMPALATADALLARGHAVHFFTDARGSRFIEPRANLHVHILPASTPVGGVGNLLRGGFDLLRGFFIALAIMLRRRPRAIIGFGSYASFSACAAAKALLVPLFLHEQNAVLGKANEALHPLARKVITSVPSVEGISRVPANKVIEAGYPIRSTIAALAARPYPAPHPGGTLDILCIGGSQGAQVFGDILPPALAELPADQRARIKLTLQVKPEAVTRARRQLADIGVAATVESFFSDIPVRLAAAQLLISRSGMSTVAEVLAAGRPTIFVPLPHGHRLEQYKNPAAAVRAGGAWLCDQKDFTPHWLAMRLKEVLAGQVDLAHMAHIARGLGRPQAADAVAEVVLGQI
jgi:UDP-N-acetylglucosamine--N-acetylmuramyl-(pentapeptide) pyrophosphoryl-undecaprenol N-acetylglucosamine transferase